jgi:hypothetical protein
MVPLKEREALILGKKNPKNTRTPVQPTLA